MKECIISLSDQANEFKDRWDHGPHYGGSELQLAKAWGAQFLGFHLETVDPGKFSCPYHLHTQEEELFVVVRGHAVLRQDGEFRRLKAGDLVFFPVNSLHHFYNPGPEPFVFLGLSNNSKEDSCRYPDSRKTLQKSPRKIYQDGREVEDYWLGEENPRDFWPAEWLNPI